MSYTKPLEGVKIVEISTIVTASLATMMMADQGTQITPGLVSLPSSTSVPRRRPSRRARASNGGLTRRARSPVEDRGLGAKCKMQSSPLHDIYIYIYIHILGYLFFINIYMEETLYIWTGCII